MIFTGPANHSPSLALSFSLTHPSLCLLYPEHYHEISVPRVSCYPSYKFLQIVGIQSRSADRLNGVTHLLIQKIFTNSLLHMRRSKPLGLPFKAFHSWSQPFTTIFDIFYFPIKTLYQDKFLSGLDNSTLICVSFIPNAVSLPSLGWLIATTSFRDQLPLFQPPAITFFLHHL